jgi:hypothetical protein
MRPISRGAPQGAARGTVSLSVLCRVLAQGTGTGYCAGYWRRVLAQGTGTGYWHRVLAQGTVPGLAQGTGTGYWHRLLVLAQGTCAGARYCHSGLAENSAAAHGVQPPIEFRWVNIRPPEPAIVQRTPTHAWLTTAQRVTADAGRRSAGGAIGACVRVRGRHVGHSGNRRGGRAKGTCWPRADRSIRASVESIAKRMSYDERNVGQRRKRPRDPRVRVHATPSTKQASADTQAQSQAQSRCRT